MNHARMNRARKTAAVAGERRCKICGRVIEAAPSRRGPKPIYCRPRPDERRSKCGMIAKRADELRRMAEALVYEVERGGGDVNEVAVAASTVKSFIWSELNSATNVLGRLAKKRNGNGGTPV